MACPATHPPPLSPPPCQHRQVGVMDDGDPINPDYDRWFFWGPVAVPFALLFPYSPTLEPLPPSPQAGALNGANPDDDGPNSPYERPAPLHHAPSQAAHLMLLRKAVTPTLLYSFLTAPPPPPGSSQPGAGAMNDGDPDFDVPAGPYERPPVAITLLLKPLTLHANRCPCFNSPPM